jgi:hypothetical protein
MMKMAVSKQHKTRKTAVSNAKAKPTKAEVKANAMIDFVVKGKVTNFGEDIFVKIGNKEVPITWKSHDTWEGQVELPVNQEVQYCYVMKRGGHELERTGMKKRVLSNSSVRDNWN